MAEARQGVVRLNAGLAAADRWRACRWRVERPSRPTIGNGAREWHRWAIVLVLSCAPPAWAQDVESNAEPAAEAPATSAPDDDGLLPARTPSPPRDPQGLAWDPRWRRVGLTEYVVGGVSGAGALALFLVERPQTPSWREPVLFDDWMRRRLRLTSSRARSRAKTWSDIVDGVSAAHLFVIDSWIVPAAVHRSPEVAWQLFGINLQSYGVSLLINRLVKRFTARARPFVEACQDDPEMDAECGSREAYAAFYSGHSTSTATSAGLICAHHTHLELYGGGFADAAACAASISFAFAAGSLRIASDNHWATDVIVGHLTGLLSGYVLPSLLYYRGFGKPPSDQPSSQAIGFVWPERSGVQFGLMGYF